MNTGKTISTADAVRHLIVCDTQFTWAGVTNLTLEQMMDLQARGWVVEGDDNDEFQLTVAGEEVVARALQHGVPKTLADVKPGGMVRLGDALPPLPIRQRFTTLHGETYAYSAEQMQDYARAALSAQPSPGGQGDDMEPPPYVLDAGGMCALESFLVVAEEFRRSAEPYIESINEGGDAGEDEVSEVFDRMLNTAKGAVTRFHPFADRQPVEASFASALEETRVRDLREAFDAAYQALTNPTASIPSDEWGGRKDMMCPDDEDEALEFNRSGWSSEVETFGPLGVRPEDSIVLTASAVASIQRVLMELLQAATAARQPVGDEERAETYRKGWEAGNAAQAVDLGQFRSLARSWIVEAGGTVADTKHACADELLALIDSQAVGNG